MIARTARVVGVVKREVALKVHDNWLQGDRTFAELLLRLRAAEHQASLKEMRELFGAMKAHILVRAEQEDVRKPESWSDPKA